MRVLRLSSILLLGSWSLVCRFAPAELAAQDRVDPLAADAVSARYRTGNIDPVVERVPADIEALLKTNPADGLTKLVAFLTEGADDFTKAKRIHDWIGLHIAYDSDRLLGLSDEGSRKVNEVLQMRRTTCGGFAELFRTMNKMAGVEVISIGGISRAMYSKASQDMAGHVWSAVRTNGRWYIVDSTADARRSYKHGKFSDLRKYSDANLFLSPRAKILINLPNKQENQFLDPVVSREDFLQAPQINLGFLRYGLSYSSGSSFEKEREPLEGGKLEKVHDLISAPDGTASLEIDAPPFVVVRAKLTPVSGEEVQTRDGVPAGTALDHAAPSGEESTAKGLTALVESESRSQKVIVRFSAPAGGLYKAEILAKAPDRDASFSTVHTFRLRAGKAGPALPDRAGSPALDRIAFLRGISIRAARLAEADGSIAPSPMIEIAAPKDIMTSAVLYTEENQAVRGAVQESFLPDAKRFYLKISQKGRYYLKISAAKGESGRDTAAIVRIEAGAPAGTVIPPPGEAQFTKVFAERGRLLSEDFSSGRREKHTVRIAIAGKVNCVLRDSSGTAVRKGCKVFENGSETSIEFYPPENGAYRASISQAEDKKGLILFGIPERR